MAEKRFLLCRLPVNVTNLVVKSMPDIERVSISFCSRIMKSMAISPGLRGCDFFVKIGECCEVSYVGFNRRVFWNSDHFTGEEEVRVGPTFARRDQCIIWKQPGWSTLDWFDHLHVLFPDVKTKNVDFNADTFDLNLLPLLYLSDVNGVSISGGRGNTFLNLQLLNYFEKVDEIELDCPRFDTATQVASILMRNLHMLEIGPSFKITFEELLLVNCEYLVMEDDNLNWKQINKFLKMWIRGSNPNLRYFCFYFDDWEQVVDYAQILTGTNFRYLNDTEESQYVDCDGNVRTIEGDFEIRNKDGIKGIVTFYEDESEVKFVVIDD